MLSSLTRPSAQLFLLSSLAASAFAQTTTASSGNQCPSNELNYFHDGKQWCCPGAIYGGGSDHVNDDSAAFCCVGATFEVPGPSFAPCFPFCNGSANGGATVTSTTSQPCSATVFLTDADYSAKVTSAAASVSAEQKKHGASTTSHGGGAAMITSGPMMGMMAAAGGLLLAV
ncbi:hypothetical protein CERZMDRAFT_94455 [Cercospora zeae-maydis SCOH1-5]|uniref:WSC domain-containing protein n=1 Tax=Cercospora zeae-maydis SCOH1-5 TaxID=717836 RepID=A0A6A6FRG4_9PEZI|nr:hypothetical protein CERZMDRAFT_94455 [Cercospora zeae-maydis SCOH1-5]